MLSSTELRTTLKLCKNSYDSTNNRIYQKLLLKLAILEVSGWIEECLDEFYRQINIPEYYFNRRESLIKKVNAFSLEHFSNVCIEIQGYNGFYLLESGLKSRMMSNGINCYTRFKSITRQLVDRRNQMAHTHLQGDSQLLSWQQIEEFVKDFIKVMLYMESLIKK